MEGSNSFEFISNLKKKNTYVENFETSNIQYTDELDTFLTSFQSLVDSLYQPLEQTIENSLRHGSDRVKYLQNKMCV